MPEPSASASAPPFPFGLRAHDLGRLGAAELAAKARALGASFVQLAPAKALEGVADTARDFGPAEVAGVREAFREAGLSVAVLSCYVGLGSASGSREAASLAAFRASLAAARELGMAPVGTEAGRRGAGGAGSRARRLAFTRELALLVAEAEGLGVRVAVEAARGTLVAGPAELASLLRDLASPSLAVILDPVNLIASGRPSEALEGAARVLDFAADRVVALHLKDAVALPGFGLPGLALPVPPGSGKLDFAALAALLAGAGLKVPLVLEGCPPARLPKALAILDGAGFGLVAAHPKAIS